jgi:uncharacterized membrane protein
MALLILGLAMFMGVHLVRVVADPWRTRMVQRIGLKPWKGLYALVSIVGFVILVIGFRHARQESTVLYTTPDWMKHVTAVLMMLAMVLLAATYVPKNWFKARFHHPQVLAVKTWAVAHLLSVGVVADVVLFGAFLVWAVVLFVVLRRRDRRDNVVYAPGNAIGTTLAIAFGLIFWSVFALLLHGPLIGVRPLGY